MRTPRQKHLLGKLLRYARKSTDFGYASKGRLQLSYRSGSGTARSTPL